MAFKHSKDTIIKVATKDLSAYTDSSELNQSADKHDVTTYGNQSHRKAGGLLDGTFKMSGTYDTTAVTGPRAALKPLLGTTVAVIRQPEGTLSGKPQDSFNAVMTGYVETNPVADMIKWSAEFDIDGDVNSAAQV
jgi:hypothetical protein